MISLAIFNFAQREGIKAVILKSDRVVPNVLDCGIVVSKFNLQLHVYVHFWTNTHG